MGYFSWKTADTDLTIANEATGLSRPVYMLQPNGKEPILERSYEGYGEFGGVDAYVWLAENNLPKDMLDEMDDEEKRNLGIGMDVGQVYRHAKTDTYWSIFHNYSPLVEGCKYHQGRYDSIIPELGKSANELLESGEFEEVELSALIKNPLKFSFSPDAVYEDLPASKNCPEQGYFLSEETEDQLEQYNEEHPFEEIEKNTRKIDFPGGTPFRFEIKDENGWQVAVFAATPYENAVSNTYVSLPGLDIENDPKIVEYIHNPVVKAALSDALFVECMMTNFHEAKELRHSFYLPKNVEDFDPDEGFFFWDSEDIPDYIEFDFSKYSYEFSVIKENKEIGMTYSDIDKKVIQTYGFDTPGFSDEQETTCFGYGLNR
jgi:hypothetical protein